MTGEIRELTRGELSFRIAGVGRVDIDWRNVVELESPDRFYIVLASGEREVGTLSVSGGQLSITTEKGTRRIDMNEVVRIGSATERRFVEGLSGSIDVGFDILSANDEVDARLVSDDPTKVLHAEPPKDLLMLPRLLQLTGQARVQFDLMSPDFVPGTKDLAQLAKQEAYARRCDCRRSVIGLVFLS